MEKSFGGSFDLSYSFVIRLPSSAGWKQQTHTNFPFVTPVTAQICLQNLNENGTLTAKCKNNHIEIPRPKTKQENFLGNQNTWSNLCPWLKFKSKSVANCFFGLGYVSKSKNQTNWTIVRWHVVRAGNTRWSVDFNYLLRTFTLTESWIRLRTRLWKRIPETELTYEFNFTKARENWKLNVEN